MFRSSERPDALRLGTARQPYRSAGAPSGTSLISATGGLHLVPRVAVPFLGDGTAASPSTECVFHYCRSLWFSYARAVWLLAGNDNAIGRARLLQRSILSRAKVIWYRE